MVKKTDKENDLADVENVPAKLEIEVGDPQILRPTELPLVVKPGEGQDWKNDAQRAYAAVLNAYAYSKPEKWAVKKAVLIEQLKQLGDNPGLINVLNGNADSIGLTYSDKRIQQ